MEKSFEPARGIRRRTAVVAGAPVHAADSAQMARAQQRTSAAQPQAATAEKEADAAKQQAAAAATPAPPSAGTGKPLPLGTVVSTLPAGCTSKPVGGVEYYHCGGNYHRAAFQGNGLVYVTAQP